MNAINDGGEHDVLAAAKEDQESVVELTRELIRLPSRGGVDPYEPVLERLSRYFEGPDTPDDVAGVMIGYPGMDKLVVGGRGVHRTKLGVHGVVSRSGGSKSTPSAIEKAAHLIRVLSTAELPEGASTELPLSGKLTVTAVEGGQGSSVTPDLCTLDVDIVFDGQAASRLLEHLVAEVDDAWPGTRPTLIQVDTRWPAYVLPDDSRLRTIPTIQAIYHATVLTLLGAYPRSTIG